MQATRSRHGGNPAWPCGSAPLEALERRTLLSGAEAGGPAFDHFLYYPEGFAGSTITEFLPLGNPNSVNAQYRVIAHFETDRPDLVLAEGTLTPMARGGITISRAADHSGDLVEPGVPYALEVQSTEPLVASISHYDFGSATGETFTDTTAESWSFPQVGTGEGRHDFPVWYNTAASEATITVRFIAENADVIVSLNTTTRAMGRGGLDLSQVEGLPESGTFAAVVFADQPIVAAASRYFSLGDQHSASTELGTPAPGAAAGVAPLGSLANGATEEIAFLDARENSTLRGVAQEPTVTLTFRPSDEAIAPIQRTLTLTEFGVTRFDVTSLAAELGASRYAIEYTSTIPLVGRIVHHEHGEDATTRFSQVSTRRSTFADGFMDPQRAGEDVFETIGLRLLPGGTETGVHVVVRFASGAGFIEDFSFNANGVFALDLHNWATLAHWSEAYRQYFYTIEVVTDSPAVASMWHYDLTLGAQTPAGGFGAGAQPQAAAPPAPPPPPPPAQGTALYDINTAFALGHGAGVTPLGGVLDLPAGSPGQIELTLLGGVFNFDANGSTLIGGAPATNRGLNDLEGSLTLVGDGASLALATNPRVPPFTFGSNAFNGAVSADGHAINGFSPYVGQITMPWPDGGERPAPPELGVEELTRVYRFVIDITDTTTLRDIVVTFTGLGFAAVDWIPVSETEPADGADGSVWWAAIASLPPIVATPVSLTVRIS